MIDFENVCKFYRIKKHTKVVLDHVSLRFDAGRSYAILGVNGAGKSTLVRLIAGTELPNGGRIRRSVRVSWPLGFAGGLHPKMTGRENIYFVARIYGQDPRRVLEFVEDFAEIGPYIDAPVGIYSSGMGQRVAFGLSMAIDFECYLIDEVLAVGDARFQSRCRTEFERRKKNADIIMVSHNMHAIHEYCEHGIILADGRLHYFEDVSNAIEVYHRLNM